MLNLDLMSVLAIRGEALNRMMRALELRGKLAVTSGIDDHMFKQAVALGQKFEEWLCLVPNEEKSAVSADEMARNRLAATALYVVATARLAFVMEVNLRQRISSWAGQVPTVSSQEWSIAVRASGELLGETEGLQQHRFHSIGECVAQLRMPAEKAYALASAGTHAVELGMLLGAHDRAFAILLAEILVAP